MKVNEINRRFADNVGKIAEVQEILKAKPEIADLSNISRIFGFAT